MPFQCYWSTNPAYDYHQRVEDFWFQLIRAHYGVIICFDQLSTLEGNLADIVSRTHWVVPPTHDVNFTCFDLIKATLKLDNALEEVERELFNRPDLKYRIMAQYSKDGFQNLDYGELI